MPQGILFITEKNAYFLLIFGLALIDKAGEKLDRF